MIVRIIIFITLLLTGFNNLGLVSIASAEETKVYPGIASFAGCSGKDCTACHMVNLVNEGITWLIGIFFVLFAVLVAIAGIRLVTAGGNPGALSSAKDSFINAIVGLIIVLSAWLIVDTVMRGLLKNDGQLAVVDGGQVTGWLAWSQVECYVPKEPKEYEIEIYLNGTQLSEAGMILTPSEGTVTGSITPTGNLVEYAGAKFDSAIIDKVSYIANTFGLRVSGGYRTPERNREVGGVPNSNHLTGRAADFVGTQDQMQTARNWAISNGAKEYLIHNAGSGTHLHVAW